MHRRYSWKCACTATHVPYRRWCSGRIPCCWWWTLMETRAGEVQGARGVRYSESSLNTFARVFGAFAFAHNLFGRCACFSCFVARTSFAAWLPRQAINWHIVYKTCMCTICLCVPNGRRCVPVWRRCTMNGFRRNQAVPACMPDGHPLPWQRLCQVSTLISVSQNAPSFIHAPCVFVCVCVVSLCSDIFYEIVPVNLGKVLVNVFINYSTFLRVIHKYLDGVCKV